MLMLILLVLLLFAAIGISAMGAMSQRAMENIFDNEQKNK